ncbi:MAG: glycosyltransferase family 9 protein [Elusimicrobiota bacterium]
MNLKTMKFLDCYAGFVACSLLTLHKKITVSFQKPPKLPEKPGAILMMKFWGMGSILLASHAVKAIKDCYPGARTIFLTLLRNKGVCDFLEVTDEYIYLEIDKGIISFIKSLWGIIISMRKRKPDIVIDFEFFTRFSAVVTYLSAAKFRVGYHAWEVWRGDLHNIKVPFNRYWHIVDNFLNLTSAAGAIEKTGSYAVKPKITAKHRKEVTDILMSAGLNPEEKYVCIHVNSSDLIVERRWPYNSFIELLKIISNKYPERFIFIGTKMEVESITYITNKIASNRVINLVGKLNIAQLAALFEGARLLIASDSGPLHLADAIGTPTVSFFGPETPALYGPRGKNNIVLFKNIDCSPCINVHSAKTVRCYRNRFNPRCMESITVDEALKAVERILQNV